MIRQSTARLSASLHFKQQALDEKMSNVPTKDEVRAAAKEVKDATESMTSHQTQEIKQEIKHAAKGE